MALTYKDVVYFILDEMEATAEEQGVKFRSSRNDEDTFTNIMEDSINNAIDAIPENKIKELLFYSLVDKIVDIYGMEDDNNGWVNGSKYSGLITKGHLEDYG